jgi:hypothetical protein
VKQFNYSGCELSLEGEPRFLLEILIFKGLTSQRLYKPFGIKGLIDVTALFSSIVELRWSRHQGRAHHPVASNMDGSCKHNE